MNRQYFVYRFQLNSDLATHEEVHSVTTVQVNTLVIDRQGDLAPEVQMASREFMAHAGLISRFQQARTQFPVHIDCGRDYLASQISMQEARLLANVTVITNLANMIVSPKLRQTILILFLYPLCSP